MTLRVIQTESEFTVKRALAFDWLTNNPRRWPGKQVLNRKNGGIYTIREVMPRGTVELEKKGVLYTTNIQALRADYEMASP